MTSPPNPQPRITAIQTKAIPPARDRLQSRILVWAIAPLLCLAATVAITIACFDLQRLGFRILVSMAISLAFALLVWRLKAATPAAAACGGVICLLLTCVHEPNGEPRLSGLAPLLALFVLTHIATLAGRHRKTVAGLSEPHIGRCVSQVIANLSVAGLLAFPVGIILVATIWRPEFFDTTWIVWVLVLSTLAEAAADTVSSEIGQAFAGPAFLVTNFRRVPTGTDGAITLTGTLAGIFAAAIVTAAGAWSMRLSLKQSAIALTAAICGLFFDSLLGATLERRGWIGNDLVNFLSTAFAATVSLAAIHFFRDWLLRSPATN